MLRKGEIITCPNCNADVEDIVMYRDVTDRQWTKLITDKNGAAFDFEIYDSNEIDIVDEWFYCTLCSQEWE